VTNPGLGWRESQPTPFRGGTVKRSTPAVALPRP
jgi:hypothetical protein